MGESYTKIRGGKHRDNWLLMGSEHPDGLSLAKNNKEYDGVSIV